MKIKLSEIKEMEAKREHGKLEFTELKESIGKIGLIEPLVINQNNKLLCGRRRYQAISELGWTDVDVRVIKTSNELEEFDIALDENIKRKQLTPLEEGQALLERKRIYERLYPETKREATLKQNAPNGKVCRTVDSFVLDTAKKLGISERGIRHNIQAAEIVEKHPELAKEKKVSRIIEKHKRMENLKKFTPIPAGKYSVLYADPPWQYNNSGFEQSAEGHYETMSTEKICQLPVRDVTTEKAVLFLWVTNAFVKEGLRVCEEWGFDYKTNMVWIKNKGAGIGWFLTGRHELLFIATKGAGMHPDFKPVSWFNAESKEHSKKPGIIYETIEKMYPNQKYCELFARKTKREKWTFWGNEIGKFK